MVRSMALPPRKVYSNMCLWVPHMYMQAFNHAHEYMSTGKLGGPAGEVGSKTAVKGTQLLTLAQASHPNPLHPGQ